MNTRTRISIVTITVIAAACTNGGDGGTPSTTTTFAPTTSSTTTTPLPPTTSTTTTTTTSPPSDAFIGLWGMTGPEGDTTRVDFQADGTSSAVNSATICTELILTDAYSTSTGSYTYDWADDGIVAVDHTTTLHCYTPDAGRILVANESTFTTAYDVATDTFDDGLTRLVEDNPFVGTWSGIDADGSVFTMVIRASGVYEQRDTAASTCERLGLGSAPWASFGWAEFVLEPIPTAHLTGTTVCFDDEDQPVVSTTLSDNDWFWAYDAGTDRVIFSADNTALSRVDV